MVCNTIKSITLPEQWANHPKSLSSLSLLGQSAGTNWIRQMCLLPSCHIFNFVVRYIYLWKVTILLLGTQNLVHWSRIKLNNYNLLSESFHDLNWSATRIQKLQLNLSIFTLGRRKLLHGWSVKEIDLKPSGQIIKSPLFFRSHPWVFFCLKFFFSPKKSTEYPQFNPSL